MNWKRIITWISIIGSIASIIGLAFIFYPSHNDTIKLEFSLEGSDNLTSLNNLSEPEIKARFEYKGNEILRLWRINIVLENISKKTLIGSGALKNIINKDLIFYTQPKFQIIDKKLVKADFNHNLEILNKDTILISFGQWRTAEQLRYALYLKTDSDRIPTIDIFRQPLDRQIVDGDIIFRNKEETKQVKLLTDKLGRPTKMVAYVISIIILGIQLILVLAIIVSNIGGFYLRKTWYIKHYNTYKDFVLSHSKPTNKEFHLANPEKYPGWSKYPGVKYPDEWGLDFEIVKTFNFISLEFFLIVLSFALSILIIDVIQLFP